MPIIHFLLSRVWCFVYIRSADLARIYVPRFVPCRVPLSRTEEEEVLLFLAELNEYFLWRDNVRWVSNREHGFGVLDLVLDRHEHKHGMTTVVVAAGGILRSSGCDASL